MGERIGALFTLRDDAALVERIDRLGYDSLWAAESFQRTAFGKLERWATVTDRVRLGTGIVNVYARTPATVAQAIATLDDHSDGRAILGLGVASPGVVRDFHGVPFERPLDRMAEYVALVRRYLSGTADGFRGEFFSPAHAGLWDGVETRSDIPIYNAALGPRNVRLTGEIADGWLPNLYPLDGFERAKGWLAAGAERAGRDVDDIDVAMYVLAAVADDPAVARHAAARHVAFYLREAPGYYDRTAERAGFGDDVRRARGATDVDAAAGAISDGFLDSLAITGTPSEAREQLRTIRDAGVDLPIVRVPINVDDRELVERTFEAFA